MNTNLILGSCLAFASLTLARPLQEPAATRKLARIQPDAQRAEKHPQSQQAASEDWKKRLGDADLERREQAYGELLERARTDDALRGALESWSKSADAGELAWTSRLLLRELRNAPRADAFGRAPRLDDLQQRFDQLERNFGGMDSMFEDLRRQMDGWQSGQLQTPGASHQSQSYSLQVGPDGVTLEMTEDADGNGQKKTYKAKDMQELLAQHPELRDRIGGYERFDLHGAPGQNWFSLRNGQPQNDWLRSPRPSQQPPTDVLGIYSQKLTPEQAHDLDLEPEQGLRVERIEPGTIAQVLGLRRGDTLVELNGKPVYSADDVRRVLKERAADEELSVTLIGEGSKDRRTLRWSPSEPQPSSGELPAQPLKKP